MTDIVGPDHSNAIACPPVVYAAGLVAGIGLDILWPVPILPDAVQFALGGTVLCISGAIMPFVIRGFIKVARRFQCGARLRRLLRMARTGSPATPLMCR